MILDHLDRVSLYHSLGARFQQGFQYIRDFRPEIPDGRYELDGKNLYALVQSFDTAPAEDRTFESHEVYADIHYIVSGSELIYYAPSSSLTPKAEYDAERDATFYQDQDDYGMQLAAGYLTVFWPHDAHKPGCVDKGGPVAVRKVVLKVKL